MEAEFKYYLDNQDTLVRQHKGKFVIVKGQQVIGVHDTEEEAIRETMKEHELGTFLVQFVEAGGRKYFPDIPFARILRCKKLEHSLSLIRAS